jgi:hypothetical protein
MLLVSSVTAPFLASALPPLIFAPVVNVMLVSAIRLPMNCVPVPSVADDPICQSTPHGLPPLMIDTDDALAVVSVLPVLKIQVAAAFPCALSTRGPVNCADVEKQ